jgi:hypothetical protein
MRGRPRKPTPFDWLRDVPHWISAWNANNLSTDEAIQARRETGEFHRRDAVDDAFNEGRTRANAERRNRKSVAAARALRINAGPIANARLSSSAAADFIIRHGDPCGLSHRVLRSVIADARKSWQGR